MINHGYSVTNVFSARQRHLLRTVEDFVARIPSTLGEATRCHELARAVAAVVLTPLPPLRVVDGRYNRCDHSWLALPIDAIGDDCKLIDVYSVGRLPQVQLVHDIWHTTRGAQYVPGAPRTDIRERMVRALIVAMDPLFGQPRPF